MAVDSSSIAPIASVSREFNECSRPYIIFQTRISFISLQKREINVLLERRFFKLLCCDFMEDPPFVSVSSCLKSVRNICLRKVNLNIDVPY